MFAPVNSPTPLLCRTTFVMGPILAVTCRGVHLRAIAGAIAGEGERLRRAEAPLRARRYERPGEVAAGGCCGYRRPARSLSWSKERATAWSTPCGRPSRHSGGRGSTIADGELVAGRLAGAGRVPRRALGGGSEVRPRAHIRRRITEAKSTGGGAPELRRRRPPRKGAARVSCPACPRPPKSWQGSSMN